MSWGNQLWAGPWLPLRQLVGFRQHKVAGERAVMPKVGCSVGLFPAVVQNLAPWLDADEERAWRGFHAPHPAPRPPQPFLARGVRSVRSGLRGAGDPVRCAGEANACGRVGSRARLGEVTPVTSGDPHGSSWLGLSRGVHERVAGAEVVLTTLGGRTVKSAAPMQLAEIRANFIDLLSPAQLRTLAEIADIVLEHLEAGCSESVTAAT